MQCYGVVLLVSGAGLLISVLVSWDTERCGSAVFSLWLGSRLWMVGCERAGKPVDATAAQG